MGMSPTDAMALSLGEFEAICRHWNIAHGTGRPQAPSDAEYWDAVGRGGG